MKFIYHGPSLPMVEVGNQIIRVQRLVDGQWETLESEECYALLFPELREQLSRLENWIQAHNVDSGTPYSSMDMGYRQAHNK